MQAILSAFSAGLLRAMVCTYVRKMREGRAYIFNELLTYFEESILLYADFRPDSVNQPELCPLLLLSDLYVSEIL